MKKLHIISKTHLDLGFTDYAANIEKLYLETFIPEAINIANSLNQDKKVFIWTTGSWIIQHALSNMTEDNKNKLEQALIKGYIKPHGLAFTTHTELLDADTMRYNLNIGKALSSKYKLNIRSAKMTDVPGHTRAIVPLLYEYGIKLLHIGVNEGSAVPSVPQAFVWKHNESEVVVIYEGSYGSMYRNEHIDDILYFAHSADNHGPINRKNYLKIFNRLVNSYPDYDVTASTLDEYADKIWEVRDKLPVVTSEIGDSWIHGAMSDPYKSAAIRELIQLKLKWKDNLTDSEYYALSENILKLAEHTWGMDVKLHLSDIGVYLKKDFVKAHKKDKVSLNYLNLKGIPYKLRTDFLRLIGRYHRGYYSNIEKSWQEQRGYIDSAVNALSNSRKAEAEARLNALRPNKRFSDEGMQEISLDEEIILKNSILKLNSLGGIKHLTLNGNRLIDNNDFPAVEYISYGAKDYQYWLNNYSRNLKKTKSWVLQDFARPLLNLYQGKYPEGSFGYTPDKVYVRTIGDKATILVRLIIDKVISIELGAPLGIDIRYTIDSINNIFKTEILSYDKDASRLTEAIFARFNFIMDDDSLSYIKLNEKINPYDIVLNGNRNLSAIDGIEFSVNEMKYRFINHHTPLISIGRGKILKFNNQYETKQGISYNLYNNVWGTNFPLWYSENAYYCFDLLSIQ